jgi:hypothetical protein
VPGIAVQPVHLVHKAKLGLPVVPVAAAVTAAPGPAEVPLAPVVTVVRAAPAAPGGTVLIKLVIPATSAPMAALVAPAALVVSAG